MTHGIFRSIVLTTILGSILGAAIPTQGIAGAVATPLCSQPHFYEKRTMGLDAAAPAKKAAFALDLLARLSPNSQNASVSPFGISAVLSTIYSGADPSMRRAIAATLHLAEGREAEKSLEGLRRESRLINLASVRDLHRFVTYNAVFVDHRLPLKPGASDLVMADGNVELRPLDFSSQAGPDEVNELLSKKTNGRIKSILDPGSSPSLVVANAFAFKDCWKAPFDKANTTDKPFTKADGSKADRPIMSVTSTAISYRAGERFVAVELPYVDEDFALTVVTTKAGPAKVGEFKDAGTLLAGVDLGDAKVTLALPKFGGAADNELLDVLSVMGLKPGLASGNQLPGFADGLKLDRVRQKTWLAVDEVGTEAAAVTAAEATRSAQEPKAVTVNFDKPFVYALRYRPTGTILMAGYVADPRDGQ